MKSKNAFLARVIGGLMLLIRLALGLLFIYSAQGKIFHPADFLGSVYDFRLTGPTLGLVVAITLPWIELVVGLALVAGIFQGGALLAVCAMSIMFLAVSVSAIVRGLSVSCGCFGPTEGSVVGKYTVARALLIFFFAAVVWLWQYRRASTISQSTASVLQSDFASDQASKLAAIEPDPLP